MSDFVWVSRNLQWNNTRITITLDLHTSACYVNMSGYMWCACGICSTRLFMRFRDNGFACWCILQLVHLSCGMFTLRLSKCMRLMYVFPRSAVSICDLCVYLLMCVSCLGVCVCVCVCVCLCGLDYCLCIFVLALFNNSCEATNAIWNPSIRNIAMLKWRSRES